MGLVGALGTVGLIGASGTVGLFGTVLGRAGIFGVSGKADADHRTRTALPFLAFGRRRRVEEFDAAVVLLHDLADDREAEPRTLLACRHVGLEQLLPGPLRASPCRCR